MSKLIDITGQKFGRLLVIRKTHNDKSGQLHWMCLCDCGTKTTVLGNHLKNGHTKSCGCLKKEGRNTQHGHNKKGKVSRTYYSWASMVQRCINPNDQAYHFYGGRGITVCDRWRKFKNFLEDMGEIPKGYQIDRINNNKGYYKSNCRWATPKQNCRNRRNNHLITYKGKTQCLSAWAEEFNIRVGTLRARIYKHHWSTEKALITPIGNQGKRKTNGKF